MGRRVIDSPLETPLTEEFIVSCQNEWIQHIARIRADPQVICRHGETPDTPLHEISNLAGNFSRISERPTQLDLVSQVTCSGRACRIVRLKQGQKLGP